MEILVHVSAPSSARDDARYRAQVAGILGLAPLPWLAADALETAQQAPGQPTHPEAPGSSGNSGSSGAPASARSTSEEPEPELHAAPSTLVGNWPARSPIETQIGPSRAVPRDSVHHPESFESQVSVVPDSQPAHHLLHSFPSDLPPASPRLLHSQPQQDAGAPASKRPRIDPRSPSVQPSQTANVVNVSIDSQASYPDTAQSSQNDIESHQEPMVPIEASKNEHINCITADSNLNQHETHNPLRLAANHLLPQSQSLPLEIRPPPPPISTAPFTTHITPTLSMLTERLKPSRTYKPLQQTRSLDALERGYWSMQINLTDDTDAAHGQRAHVAHAESVSDPARPAMKNARDWSAESFQRFWTFLADFVGKDARAGWGVWCVLESSPAAELSPSPAPPATFPVLLKVYAWGETAMHVYLLLFLASERRVKNMGAQWRDSREEVVIQMP